MPYAQKERHQTPKSGVNSKHSSKFRTPTGGSDKPKPLPTSRALSFESSAPAPGADMNVDSSDGAGWTVARGNSYKSSRARDSKKRSHLNKGRITSNSSHPQSSRNASSSRHGSSSRNASSSKHGSSSRHSSSSSHPPGSRHSSSSRDILTASYAASLGKSLAVDERKTKQVDKQEEVKLSASSYKPQRSLSAELKLKLIDDLLLTLKASKVAEVSDESIDVLSHKIFAASLISVLSYGYNVDNRRQMPALSEDFLKKESGLPPRDLDLNLEGLYRRSSFSHSSRYLIAQIKQSIYTRAIVDSRKEKGDSQLGEWKTPEEIFESVFSHLSKSNMVLFSIEILEKERAQIVRLSQLSQKNSVVLTGQSKSKLPSYKTKNAITSACQATSSAITPRPIADGILVPKTSAQRPSSTAFISMSFDSAVALGEKLGYQASLELLSTEKREAFAYDFDRVLEKKREIVSRIVKAIGDKASDRINVLAPENGYPCVMFDLEQFLIEHQVLGAHQKTSSRNIHQVYLEKNGKRDMTLLKSYGKFVISCFIGLINYHSVKSYGKNFIYTQEQASFSSLRPSFSDTGKSIRLSPGLTPENYSQVVAPAYADLMVIFNNAKKGVDGAKLSQAYMKFKGKRNSYKTEDAQLIMMEMVSDENGKVNGAGFLSEYLDKLIDLPDNHQTLLEQRDVRFRKVYEQETIRNDRSTPKKAKAPDELLLLYHGLLNLPHEYEKNDDFCNSFLKNICDQIATVKKDAKKDDDDYSQVTWTVETLLRLYKLKYELEYKPVFKSSVYVDKVKISGGKEGVTRTRCGMSSLNHLMQCLNAVFANNKIATSRHNRAWNVPSAKDKTTIKLSDSYFEVSSNAIFKMLNKNHKPSGNNKKKRNFKNTFVREHLVEKGGKILITDLNPIPETPFSRPPIRAFDYFADEKYGKEGKPVVSTDAKVMVVDATVAKTNEIARLQKAFEKQDKIEILITFSSNNKTGVAGNCLTTMGDIRLFENPKSTQRYQDIFKTLSEDLKAVQENSVGQEAYRRLISDLGQRPSMLAHDAAAQKNPVTQGLRGSSLSTRKTPKEVSQAAGAAKFGLHAPSVPPESSVAVGEGHSMLFVPTQTARGGS